MNSAFQPFINNDSSSEEDDIGGERDDIVEAISAAGGVLAGEPEDKGSDSNQGDGEGDGVGEGDGGGVPDFEEVEPVREVSPIASNLAWLGYTGLLKMVEVSQLDGDYPAPGFAESVKNCNQTRLYFDECCAKYMPSVMAKAGPIEGLVVMTGIHYANAAAGEKEKQIKGESVLGKRPRSEIATSEEVKEIKDPVASLYKSGIKSKSVNIVPSTEKDPVVY